MRESRQGSQGRDAAYEALTRGIENGHRGCFEESFRLFDEALEWARENQDQPLWDRIFCNRSAADFELGRIEEPRRELRRILFRTCDPESAFLAAYNIARSYDLQKDYQRAMFYSRVAQDRCLKLNRPDWLAWCHNLMARVLLSMSRAEEATEESELALKLMPFSPTVERAVILDNLGYCRLLQGRYQEGFGYLFDSLRTLTRLGAERLEPLPRVSLCFGYLEIGKYRYALRHAEVALRLAEAHGDDANIKNAYFLLGDSHNQLGHRDVALSFFTTLQERYYEDALHVPELLLAVNVRQLINLKA